MPLRDDRMAVSREDDLALLGDLEPPVHRARRLREHGAASGTAAATQRAAAAVEQRQRDAAFAGPPRQPLLHSEQPQRRADGPEFFRRVRVAEHHLKLPPGRR